MYFTPYVGFLQLTLGSHCSKFILLGTAAHTLSLFASSFVEEEHQTWYFFSLTVNILLVHNLVSLPGDKDTNLKQRQELYGLQHTQKSLRQNTDDTTIDNLLNSNVQMKNSQHDSALSRLDIARVVMVMVVSRLARSWNRTGDKWAHLPDIGDWLVR